MQNISYIDNKEQWISGFSFFAPVKVRFSETDAFGHLNNTKVFAYFEEARIDFFKEMGLMKKWMSSKVETIPVTSDLQCNYLKQIFFDEQLKVFVKVDSIGSTSFDLHYMIKNEQGDVCLTGRGRMVQVHKKTGKPVQLDPTIIEKLESSFSTCNN